ncbi:unnamed protein product, partial [Trichogramma brassicae]
MMHDVATRKLNLFRKSEFKFITEMIRTGKQSSITSSFNPDFLIVQGNLLWVTFLVGDLREDDESYNTLSLIYFLIVLRNGHCY